MNRRAAALLALAVLFAGCGLSSSSSPDASSPSPSSSSSESVSPVPTSPEVLPTEPSLSPEPASTTPPTTGLEDESLESSPTAGERWGVEWKDLENLSFAVDGEAIRLEEGKAAVSHGGASEDLYALQNWVAQGDLNGDGRDDVVAHIVLASAGSGTFHLIVPVIDDGQGGTAQRPVWAGDRIVVESIEVHDGMVEVALFDREPDEPFTVISRRQTLEIDFSGSEPVVMVIDSQPLADLPLPGPELPEIAIQLDPGAIGSIVAGSIEFRQRQGYSAYMSAGQAFTATLDAPVGVWLDVRLGDQVVASASDRSQQVQAELPATGSWQVSVVSAHTGVADYKLAIEALPLRSGSAPAPTPTVPPIDIALPNIGPTPPPDDPDRVMHFTFDDGPHPVHTLEVLDVLARYGARATFFVVGSLVERYPGTTQRIIDEGHTIGNHTWNHENLAGLPREAFDETVGRTKAVLGHRATTCLRPPYGMTDAFTRDWAAEHGLVLAMWNVYPEDWRQHSALVIAQHIVDHAAAGAVVLLHDGGGDRSRTVVALDVALSHLSDEGFRFEPLCR